MTKIRLAQKQTTVEGENFKKIYFSIAAPSSFYEPNEIRCRWARVGGQGVECLNWKSDGESMI